MSKSQRDAQRDKVAWEHVELPCSTLDWRVDFRHAPARLRFVANMYGCACGYVAVSCCNAPLVTTKFQYKPGRCSRSVASIIECVNLGWVNYLM